MVSDRELWLETSKRITTKISSADFFVLMKLHAKYFNHKYRKLCTCNKKVIRLWITQLNKYFQENQ